MILTPPHPQNPHPLLSYQLHRGYQHTLLYIAYHLSTPKRKYIYHNFTQNPDVANITKYLGRRFGFQ